MGIQGFFRNFRDIPILYIVKYDTDMELKEILFKRYAGLYLLLLFIYGCGQTVDRSNHQQDTVPNPPIQTERSKTEDTMAVDSMPDDNRLHDQNLPTEDKTAKTLAQKAEPKASQKEDIPMLISTDVMQDTLLKTVVLEEDSLMQEKVTLSVLTLAGKAAGVEEKISVRMYNYSLDTLLTGLNYSVEFLDNGKWIQVSPPKNVGWVDIGYILNPFIARDFPILLFPRRHTYRPGKYRVSKGYFIHQGSWPFLKKEVSAEFEIG